MTELTFYYKHPSLYMVVYLYLYMASQNSRRKVFQALLRFVCTYHEIKFTRKADFEIERTTKEAAVDSPSIFIKKMDWHFYASLWPVNYL